MRKKCPFPQANNVDFMIQVFLNIGVDGTTKYDVENNSGLKDRQGSYYLDALVYLGLVEKNRTKYYLTDRGREIRLSPISMINDIFCDVILEDDFLRYLYDKTRPFDTKKEMMEYMKMIIATSFDLGVETAGRRASTVNAWFTWIDGMKHGEKNE